MNDLVERLRGIYRVPITDGLGPAGGLEPENPNEFVRQFETSPIQREAADEIERLRTGVKRLSDEEELCAETTGDDPFSLVYLAAKLAAVEAENKRLLASMRRVEDYHRAKAAGIWETSREGLTEDQSKEYGIAWCVHAAAAYEIKQLASPDTLGVGHAD